MADRIRPTPFRLHQLDLATIRTQWAVTGATATATPVFEVRDDAGRVVAELSFASWKTEYRLAWERECSPDPEEQ